MCRRGNSKCRRSTRLKAECIEGKACKNPLCHYLKTTYGKALKVGAPFS